MDPFQLHARWSRARDALAEAKADWLLVPSSADFRWLTGAPTRSSERLLALALPRSGDPWCLVPALEADALAKECPRLELEPWSDGQDAFALLARRIDLERRPSLMLGEGFRVAPLLRFAGSTACRPASEILSPLRAVKDQEELRWLEEAGRHADQVVEESADFMRPGMSERQVARFAFERFEELGDTEPWAIVASGPNSALPHHMTSDRRLEENEVVILDMGAFTEGYGSDITRTYWLGRPPQQAAEIYRVVEEAQNAGAAATRDGLPAESVDRAARAVIEARGFGPAFLHRTGHGVGLEIHEVPYLVEGNVARLESGMVHSVEPGIYLRGRFGVRIEDLVVVEASGARRLNQAPKDPLPPRTRG